MKLPLKILAGVVAFIVLAFVALNLLIPASLVRDRITARISEQTGRDIKVNGDASLRFMPNPYVVLNDVSIADPKAGPAGAELRIARLEVNLNLIELLSARIDAERVVLVEPVLTIHLNKDPADRRTDAGKTRHHAAIEKIAYVAAKADAGVPAREIKLRDVRIENGAVDLLYDDKGTERRIEHIEAAISLPAVTDPLTAKGKFDWKGETVDFDVALTSVADLRAKRPAKLYVALDQDAIAVRFDGSVSAGPDFTGEGDLSAKAHSLPSLLAWMREKPSMVTALGDGELASHLAWTEGEISFSQTRFALEHATGQGQAVVTLRDPKPHVRAAFAIDRLDLNPFLSRRPGAQASGPTGAPARPVKSSPPVASGTTQQDDATSPGAAPSAQDWFTKPEAPAAGGAPVAKSEPSNPPPAAAAPPSQAEESTTAPTPQADETAPQTAPPQASSVASAPTPAPAQAARPASFDADVNLNIKQTRVSHLDIGPSSLGLSFRDGVLNATLGGMELYDGHGSGTLVLDASQAVPTFSGDFLLDGVQSKTLLSDAAQFSMLSGRAKMSLKINGAGDTAETIKSSLNGQGNIVVSEGTIEGINITEFITMLGEGEIPEFQQGPGAKTPFTDLGGSFTITNGVAQTSNLQMKSQLLQVTAAGTVDLVKGSLDILANPEIVTGPKGKGGANELAGLTVPIRIEGPLDRPSIRPEIKSMFADPEKAGKTVKQIGDLIQKKFKGKPVGEALGRFLGNIQIKPRGEGGDDAEPPPQPPKTGSAQPAPAAPSPQAGEVDEPSDPDVDAILR